MNHPWPNPVGTDGFEFVEYSSDHPEQLAQLFENLGFRAIARHRSKQVTLYRQGGINFILNAEPTGQPLAFKRRHGPSANAIAFRVKDASQAIQHLLSLGATLIDSGAGPMELCIPAIEGIGGSLIYLVDRYGKHDIYEIDFLPIDGVDQHPSGVGLTLIDHLTHNVERGHMDQWADFYQRLFNFRQIRYFDIKGRLTGLHSRALTSPCGQIRIPINESSDDQSQIAEYLRAHNGEGIQHIALASDDIYASVDALRQRGVKFMRTPDSYFDAIDQRLPGHGEDTQQLRRLQILIDGEALDKINEDLLLQIFTDTVIGPIFFEIIQRKGNQGFGEGNFQALFDSIEQDQVQRGVIKPDEVDPGGRR